MEPIFDTLLRWVAESHELRGLKLLVTANDPVYDDDDNRIAPTFTWLIEASEYEPAEEGPDDTMWHFTAAWSAQANSQDEAAMLVLEQLRATGRFDL